MAALLFLSLRGPIGVFETKTVFDVPLFDVPTILLPSHLYHRMVISLAVHPLSSFKKKTHTCGRSVFDTEGEVKWLVEARA